MEEHKFYTILNGEVTELSTMEIAFLLEYRMSSPETKAQVVSLTEKFISESKQNEKQE